ncbi:helix-turn-helix domain-containing protein [Rhizobium mesosinicum]|uniref:Helix-turn-helix transcriptional regulator n=1 Tax=Rhizobium mesosinicum TaxID=335017 RepID=A0ABS7GN67_9HYPH|nr:AraC family transcriptional regulator [Rhizobium mesosinicum]MBW9051101.1 helix-turn-helix transcriptional regulator [Rhizobium mesosinicum]
MNHQATQAATGAQIAKLFGVSDFQTLRSSGLRSEQITVTRLRSSNGGTGMTDTIPEEKASVISFQLENLQHHELWKNDKLFYAGGFAADTTSVVHLSESPRAYLPVSYDCLQFHIPDLVLRELSEQEDFPTFVGLGGKEAKIDPLAAHLSRSLLPALANPAAAGRLFFDHVGVAYCMHLLRNYCGDARPPSKSSSLSDRQVRVAQEFLEAGMQDEPSLMMVAQNCGMSVSVFIKAFRQSTGSTPHEWLRMRRIEVARDLLGTTSDTLADIAYACGFADQSHMNRLFVSLTGETPGQYRTRMRGSLR